MTDTATVLAPDEVRLHWIAQTGTPQDLDADRRLLDAADAAYIASLRRTRDREAATRRRAGVLRVLAQALGRPPEGVSITRTVTGAPHLADPSSRWLRFSVAQRDAWAVVALGHGIDVGVDVERRVTMPYRQLADRGLGAAARRQIDAAPDPAAAFFDAWTALEASVKLARTRLADVVDGSGTPDAALGARRILRPAAPPGYVVAVAVRRRPARVVEAISCHVAPTSDAARPGAAAAG